MSGRWTSVLRKKATDAAANAVVQAVVWFGGSIVLPYLGSKYGPDWPGRFLTASVRLPSWVLVSCALFAIGVTWKAWATLRRRKRETHALRAEIERRDRRTQTFSWGGAEWPLTENFWSIVLRTSAEDLSTASALLNGAIGDPLCANLECRHEVWPYATSGKCGECGSALQMGLARMESVPADVRLDLKRRVYRDARAEYFRRQHPLL